MAASPVRAQDSRASDLRERTAAIQLWLLWTGHLDAAVTGRLDEETRDAVRAFQRSIGERATGELTALQLGHLSARANSSAEQVGFKVLVDDVTGIQLGLPMKLLPSVEAARWGRTWMAADKSIIVGTIEVQRSEHTLESLFQLFCCEVRGRRIKFQVPPQGRDRFALEGEEGDRDFSVNVTARGGTLRGVVAFYKKSRAGTFYPIMNVISAHLVAFPSPPAVATVPPPAPAPPRRGPETAPAPSATAPAIGSWSKVVAVSTGSGFLVSGDGHIVTNAHVVGECSRIEAVSFGEARLVNLDRANDLALLKVATGRRIIPLRLARVDQPVRRGEEVLALGFPLSDLLGADVKVTKGIVSALAGPSNNTSFLQMDAPVQAGNSGGPLVDLEGRVVGVVTAKLNAVETLKRQGDLPQSVNFAVKSDQLAMFLNSQGLAVEAVARTGQRRDVPDVVAQVQAATLAIRCLADAAR